MRIVMGKVLPFVHTDFTLKRRIAREFSREDKDILEKALRDYQLTAGFSEPGPCTTDEDWQSFLDGDYEL